MNRSFGYVSLLLLSLAGSVAARAETFEIASAVDRVTLYRDRADIERVGDVSLPKGDHLCVFGAVPQTLNPESLKIGGVGSRRISILGIKYRTRVHKDDRSKDAERVRREVEAVDRQMKVLQRKRERLQGESQLLTQIKIDRDVQDSEDRPPRPRDPKDIREVLALVKESGARIDSETDVIEAEIQALTEKRAVLQAELATFGGEHRAESIVEVRVHAEDPGPLKLRLGYQMQGASWQPDYSLARTGGDSSFKLETFALARQSTGEDWSNVELVLSTARPHLGLARPGLLPATLRLYSPPPPAAHARAFGAKESRLAKAESAMQLNELAGASADMELDALADGKRDLPIPAKVAQQEAQVSGEGIVTYQVKARTSIKSDNTVERVKLTERELNGQVTAIAVPARSPHVYDEALLKNTLTEPLLAGTVSVFADGDYVGKQQLPYTPAGKDMRLSLGIANDIVVERKRTKDFEDDSGVLRSIRRLRKDYEISLENVGGRPRRVIVLEPGAVSTNDKISVSVLDESPPSIPAADESRLEKTPGILEWRIDVPAKKKMAVTYGTTVEFERSLAVSGPEMM